MYKHKKIECMKYMNTFNILLSSLASADYWPGFKTTFGPVPGVGDAFKDRPRTATDAEAAGWQLIDSCNGVWLGSRYQNTQYKS